MRAYLTRGILVLAATGVALAIAGCGGGDSSSPSTTAVSKAEFLQKGNAICKTGNQRLKAANDQEFRAYIQNGTQAPPDKVRAFVTATLIPNLQRQVDQLRALPVPAGDEAAVEKILDTAQADIDAVMSNPDLLVNNQPAFEDANRLATAYGLTECGS